MARATVRTHGKAIALMAFPEYRGRTFKADWSGSVTFYDCNWSGGSRNEYRAVCLTDDRVNELPSLAPWCNPVEGRTTLIPFGWAVVEHSVFCGKDCGLRVYYGDASAQAVIPGYDVPQLARKDA